MGKVTNPNLLEQRGIFVTLHKHGRLRGCIGTFSADRPLYEIAGDMAISAAFNDQRFRPLRFSAEIFGEKSEPGLCS